MFHCWFIGLSRRNFDDNHYMRSSSKYQMRPRRDENFTTKKSEEDPTDDINTLEKLYLCDTDDIPTNIRLIKEVFSNLMKTPKDRPEMFVLVVKVTAKICQSPFDQLKLFFILDVCNSPFIHYLCTYLMDLHYEENKKGNETYWQDQVSFWTNITVFCETITLMSPSTAAKSCRSLIEDTSKHSLEKLDLKCGFKLPDEINLRLLKVRESLINFQNNLKVFIYIIMIISMFDENLKLAYNKFLFSLM